MRSVGQFNWWEMAGITVSTWMLDKPIADHDFEIEYFVIPA
jgi:hypothetical protein